MSGRGYESSGRSASKLPAPPGGLGAGMPDRDADLRPAVAQAIAELDAEHYAEEEDGGTNCVVCWDGSWPCVVRQVADDLRAALEGES